MFKKISCFLTVIILFFTFGGCEKNENKLSITVTILPQKAFVQAVVKDLVSIEVLVPVGASPESYEPTQRQIVRIRSSSLYFKIGVPVENTSLIKAIDNIKIIDSSEKVRETYDDREFSLNNRDPHIWLSIKRAIIMVQQIADEISIIDSANSAFYQANATDYISQLNALQVEVESCFINKTNKLFMTFHPAYGYLADDFGLEMFELNEDGKEATIERRIDFIDKAKTNNIKVIFSQEEYDSNQDSWVETDIGATITKLDPLSYYYIDNYKYMAQQISNSMI